ncbi:CD59 glycoprotein-like [Lethenteron reissneri]|uniref:CD59 glycoprotein-like n=1 Tax=Lethenteron reissneri TaxID=7753 RepID=UPI002AB711C8|nr:CD59 glycoprotein-like [Lethenteron reissneri]
MTCHLLGLLLVSLLFVSGGHSIKCYSCRPTSNNTVCNEGGPIQCSDSSHNACGSIVAYEGSTFFITKKCYNMAECKALDIMDVISNGHAIITCCQWDGCNYNAAPRQLGAAHVTLALLGVATSVVVSRALV